MTLDIDKMSPEHVQALNERVRRGELAAQFLRSEIWVKHLKPYRDARHLAFDRDYWHPEARKNAEEAAMTHVFQSGRAAELYEQEKDLDMWVEDGIRAAKQLEIIYKRQDEKARFRA